MPSAHQYTDRRVSSRRERQASYSRPHWRLSLPTTDADSPLASGPTSSRSASAIWPVEMPFKFSHGSATSGR